MNNFRDEYVILNNTFDRKFLCIMFQITVSKSSQYRAPLNKLRDLGRSVLETSKAYTKYSYAELHITRSKSVENQSSKIILSQ